MSVYNRPAGRGAKWLVRGLLALLLVVACRTPEDIAKNTQSNSQGEDEGQVVGGCREQLTPINTNLEDKLGFEASTIFELVSGTHEIKLTWASGVLEPTRLVLGVSKPRAYYVVSKWTNDAVTYGAACTNHMAIDATVTLQSRDGLLDDDLEHVQLVAYGSDEAHGSFRIKATALRGEYVPDLDEPECLQELLVRVLIANDGIHGTIADIVTNGPCEKPTGSPAEERLTARWGVRYLNY